MTGTAYAYSGYSNYYDIESKEAYWVSGIKKNGQDRHYLGSGIIMIDRKIVNDYLKMVNFDTLDENHYEIDDILPTDKQKILKN